MENVNRNHNFLANCAETINERYARAKEASRNTLEDLRVVGEMLNDAKEALKEEGRGAFGAWAEQFPFDKAWRARLMKLAANWQEIIAAVEALPEDKRKWSVDGVIGIWNAARKAQEQAANGGNGGAEGEGEGEGGNGGERKKRETEAERLRRELAEALAEIERLKAENAALRGEKPEGKAKAGKAANENKVDAATKARAKKVWGLYTQGGTEGEKAAAKARLAAMAEKTGMDFDAFVAACGLAA